MKIDPNEMAVSMNKGKEGMTPEKAMETAKKFESFFVGHMFQKMYESIPKSEFSGSSSATETFQGMMMQQLCDEAAKSPRGFGMAPQIAKEIQKNGVNPLQSLNTSSVPGRQEAMYDGMKKVTGYEKKV